MEFRDDQENTSGKSSPPIHGAIFMCNRETKRECLKRKLFGLPPPQINFVKKVKTGSTLFLFEYEERKLYGVFEASSDGASNIVPSAFKTSGKQFPAQIRFKSIWHCKPLLERDFGDAIRDNYYTSNKFNLGLSKEQVSELLQLFKSRRIDTQESKNPLLRGNLLNQSLSSVSGRIRVVSDDERRAISSSRNQARHAIDSPLDLTTYFGLGRTCLNSSDIPGRSIVDSDSSVFGSPQGLSSSRRVNHPYGNPQFFLNFGEYSSGVGMDAKVSPQGSVTYPSVFTVDRSPSFENQGAALRSRSLGENNLGDYIPLEDNPYTSPSSGPGKDPPYVPEYVTPRLIGWPSDIPERISVFKRLKDRLSIHRPENVSEDYISGGTDSEYEDAHDGYIPEDIPEDIVNDSGDMILTTEEVESGYVAFEEPLVNFKRRNKNRRMPDDIATESDSLSSNSASKRRKIRRPSFVREGTHENGTSGNSFPTVQDMSCHEIIKCKEKGTSEASIRTNGGEESDKFGLQTVVHPVCGEGNTQESSETSVVQETASTVCPEHNIGKTEFGSSNGGGEANEKEPTPVSVVADISENKDGSSNAEIERHSNNQDFKTRVEELLQELKGIQGSSASKQDDTGNTL